MLDSLLLELKALILIVFPIVGVFIGGFILLVLLRKGGDMWGMKEWWR